MAQKIKVTMLAILAILIVVVVLQNTETVETNILFFSMAMPRAALLFGTLAVGFICGVFTAGRISDRRNRG